MSKQFSISKKKTDRLQYLYRMLLQQKTIHSLLDKEMTGFLKQDVLPSMGLTADDFGYCDLDISAGEIVFDIERKKKDEKAKAKIEEEKKKLKGKEEIKELKLSEKNETK